MRQQPRTMLGELKVADELEGQDYEHETLRVVLDQIDRLRALADDLTEPRL